MDKLSRSRHTVPRFYLERFADDRRILTEVRLPGNVQYKVSITKAPVIRDYYNINPGKKSRQKR